MFVVSVVGCGDEQQMRLWKDKNVHLEFPTIYLSVERPIEQWK